MSGYSWIFALLILGTVVHVHALKVGSGCGKSFKSPAFTIINPVQTVKKKTWPWIVPIYRYYKNEKTWKQICVGTIIDEQWVLTAAHCLVHIEYRFVMGNRTPKRFAVTNKSLYRVPTGQFYHVGQPTASPEYEPLKMVIRPSYNGQELNPFDLLLIKLQNKLTWSHYRQPICLSDTLHAFITPNGKYKCYTAGWGDYMRGTSANWETIDQYKAPVYSHDSRICKLAWGFQSRPLGTQFCAGNPTSKIARCASDGGSPMMCQTKQGWVMIGLEHVAREVCIDDDKLGLFTEISIHVPWIMKTMSEN